MFVSFINYSHTWNTKYHLNSWGFFTIMANASAGWQLHAAKLLWETGKCPDWPWCSPQNGCWPGHLQPRGTCQRGVRQGSASGSVQAQSKRGKLRSEPNFKVMEDSQDQHEGMNFKHVLLCFEKLKPWNKEPLTMALPLNAAHMGSPSML